MLTEGRGEADGPGAMCMRHVLTMDNLQNKGDICVVNSCVENEKFNSPLCKASVVPVRPTGKFS